METGHFRPFSLNIKGALHEFMRPQVMGIVNVTPDSFYPGSRSMGADALRRKIEQFISEGVDMIDIGAYSSRPGASDVSVREEIDRLSCGLVAIRGMTAAIPVSVDTFRAEVARVAVAEMSADIVNDISGGLLDESMIDTVASLGVPYILMHMRGTPADMQQFATYEDVSADVIAELSKQLNRLSLAGVCDVIVDPGFGFAKTLEQNYRLIDNLYLFNEAFERPLLVGVSRKSMISRLLDVSADDALNGTTVLNTLALLQGASILRVHDVVQAKEAVKIVEQISH